MGEKKRYVQVGTGGRAEFYYGAIARDFRDTSELVAFCDINQTRMDYSNQLLVEKYNYHAIPTYKTEQFDDMIQTEHPDVVIVTSIDRTHHKYIIRAMELGCDVISEKPLTVDNEKCQEILDTVKRTNRNLRVTFNYRYAPHNTKIRELIMNDTIGNIHSVHFEWLLNTQHGADYFRRWHRDKRNSGGLLVHKSTHHFDLVNFWLGTSPKTVFAMGDLMFYGRENAEKRLYLDAEHEDGYQRDLSVFGDGISAEDTMGVMVRYKNHAILTYSLNAYLPYEGFYVAFNGDKGGHGGGDPVLLRDLFGQKIEDPYHRAASHIDGALSILTGIAGNLSIKTGQPVQVDNLVHF